MRSPSRSDDQSSASESNTPSCGCRAAKPGSKPGAGSGPKSGPGCCRDATEDGPPAPNERRAGPAGPPAGSVVDRRLGIDRRNMPGASNGSTGLERRRSAGRRLSDFTKSAEEGELTKEQFLFLMAIDAFKKANHRTYPTWTDVLEVVRLLGYRKTMASELRIGAAEDWVELPDTAANVRPERWGERAA